MTLDELRAAVMRRRLAEGLAVVCTMPGREPNTLYFARPESRDEFMRRAERQGGAVEIAAAPDTESGSITGAW